MIELTPIAAEQLRTLRADDPANQFLRLYVAGKTCCGYRYGLAFDEASSDEDTVTERAGISIAVDAESLPFVKGSVVDFVDSPAGRGFTVRNPELGGGGCTCGR